MVQDPVAQDADAQHETDDSPDSPDFRSSARPSSENRLTGKIAESWKPYAQCMREYTLHICLLTFCPRAAGVLFNRSNGHLCPPKNKRQKA